MTVLVDTNVLVAFLNVRDANHGRAMALMDELWDGAHGTVASVDHVLTEALTFLRRNPGRSDVSESLVRLLLPTPDEPAPIELLPTEPLLLEAAASLHLGFYDQGLSGVDALILAHARDLGATVATFDRGFRGLVPVVPDLA